MSYKSDEATRAIRTNTKGYDSIPARRKTLLGCDELLGKRIKCKVPGEFVEVSKMVTVKELYPYHVLCKYKGGIENEHELRICLSRADLIELGILTFRNGYPEVIK